MKQKKKSADFEFVKNIISNIRNARMESNIEPGKKITVLFETKSEINSEIIKANEILIKSMRTNVEEIRLISENEKQENTISKTLGDLNLYIPLEGTINKDKEIEKTKKEIENIEKFVSGLRSRLSDENFVSKAPSHVISQQKETLSKKETELEELKKYLSSLN